jgi:hypothetical protein
VVLLGGELVKHRRRVDDQLTLTVVGGKENAVSWFQTASVPDQGWEPEMTLTGDLELALGARVDD